MPYDPPYNEKQMREHGYSEALIEKLKNDPVHGWRMKTGIELIHREPTKTELMRIWKNWQLMTTLMKLKSDAKCWSLFGMTNEKLYNYLLPQYKVDRPDKDAVKYPPKESNEQMVHAWTIDEIFIHKEKYPSDEQWNFITTIVNLAAKASKDEPWSIEEVKNKVKNNNLEVYFFLQKEFVPGDDRSFTNVYHPMGALLFNPKDMFISSFAIIEKAQGQGIGFLSLKKFILMMRSEHPTKDINVNVATCNTAAKSLYKKLGFVEVSTLYGACRMTLKKDKKLEESTEAIEENVTKNIKNNLVYHGSPRKLDKLAASASTTTDAQSSVFVTPCKALAYCFTIDKDAVLGAVEKQFARRVLKCNFGYDIWNKPVSELYKVPQNITIELNIRGIKPIHGKSVGYIYTVDFNKYKEKCHMYHDSDVEITINGDVDYIKREKVEVNWTCVSSELAIKHHGEGQLGTSDLGRESGEEGYKPGQMTITDIKSIDDLKAFYKTVKYGIRESDQDAYTKWRLSTYRYLVHHPEGICYDTAVMSDHFLTQWNIKHMMLFMYADINKGWEDTPTHMTVIYQDPKDKLYKWLEGSWSDFKNNNWAEKDPKVLVKNIATAHANSCHHPVKIGAIEKAPVDGTCMIEFYNQVRAQCDHHLFTRVEPDKQSATEDLKTDVSVMESLLDIEFSEEDFSAEALSKGITNYLNIGEHAEIKNAHPDWEKDASFKVTEFFQNEKTEKSALLKEIVSRIKLPSEQLTDATSTIEVQQYSRDSLGAIARSIYEFYIKYIVRCNMFTIKLAEQYLDSHANETYAHDVRINQMKEQYGTNLLSEEQIINYAPYIVKQYAPIELRSAFELNTDSYVEIYISKLEEKRRSDMLAYPSHWYPVDIPDFALVFYLSEMVATHHTGDLYANALTTLEVTDENQEKILEMYSALREMATGGVLVKALDNQISQEELKNKESLPEEIVNKIGEYLYHGTHRDLDIKHLAVHFCKNRANLDIKAPVVYMQRTLGLASLHCAEFMKGHSSKKPDYREHFVDLEKAINSNDPLQTIEIIHNDPDLEEASGENDGFIYCTKKENCIDDLYFSTPKNKNDYLFVSYKPLPVDKKIKIHIKWHRKYDEEFAKKVKSDKYAGVEELQYVSEDNEEASTEELVQENGKYYVIRSFPVQAFFTKLKRFYKTNKLEHLLQAVKSIGISHWFVSTRTIQIHQFFIPELIFLLDRFNMAPNIIKELQENTWIGKKAATRTDCQISRVDSNMNCKLLPHQTEFVKNYGEYKDKSKLRGYLLSFSQGLGKTLTSIALMEALGKDRVIVICPKNTMVETWKSHFQRFYKTEQSIYVAGVDKQFNGQRFCIFNYDAIDKMNSMAGVKTPNMGVIVDESHNFLRIQSGRTRKLIELAKYSDKADMLLMSGTPIKAAGIEMIPIMSILDPLFDDEAIDIFKRSFGVNTKIASDVLNARLHRMMARVTKDVLDLPTKNRTTVKVKLPNGDKYTTQAVKKAMIIYINERMKYHKEHMVEYRQEFDECMKFLEKSDIAKTDDFKRYKAILDKLIRNRGQFEHGDTDIAWMNEYEHNTVEKQFPSELLHKFRHCKAAIKYLHLKVRGEVLGQFLGKLRIEMTSAMIKEANLKNMIDEAQKKTIIFTSFVDTIETCEKYVKEQGYKPIVIYGKNSGEIAPLAKLFQTDMSYNPLIASLQTLSTGATLTAANRVIFLNKPWRSVDYEQASDRVHRIGQDCPVDIISLVLDTGDKGNLSTRMEDIMDASARAFDAIVEEQKQEDDKKKKKSLESLFYLPEDVVMECKTYVDIDENPSNEGMVLLNDTYEQRVLNRMAKPHYRPTGANSWEHVQQDMANGILLLKKLKHRNITLQEYATILYHDCGCKSMYPDKEGHGLRGVEIAKPELKKCGFFSEKEIDEICTAILEHDETTNPKNMHSSELSDLLASADTNPPDIPWILNKSYVWGLRHGYSDYDKNIKNVVEYMKKENGTKGSMIYPKLYSEYYKKEIKQMQEFFDNLTVEECAKIIDKYRKENELRHNELTLPEPDTDEKIVTPSDEKIISVFTPRFFAEYNAKPISFPKEEIPTISKQKRIVTTRVSADFNTFQKGDFVKTPWGRVYIVKDRLVINKIEDHPYYEQLTESQKAFLKDYNKIAVLYLEIPEKDPDVAAESLQVSMEAIPAKYANLTFEDTPIKKKVYSICKPYYDDTGSHGYEHIKEVLATAYVLKGKKPLTDAEYTAILFHDTGRKTTDEGHSEESERIARKELPKLKYFSNDELEDIYKAILYHSTSYRKNHKIDEMSSLAELVANADKGFPRVSYYDICLRPALWILEGHDKGNEKWKRLNQYRTLDDIAQGVMETLDEYAKKYYDPNEKSLYAKVFAKERQKQNELKNNITLDIIKKTVITIMKKYDYNLPSVESLEPSMEAAKDIKDKRKKIQDYILKSMKLLDPHTDVNVKYWKNKFDTMSDKDFDDFMHYLREGKTNIHMFAPPFKVTLNGKDLVHAAHELGVKLMHHIWMTDPHTGIKYLTPEEYMVLQLPVRRQQQFLDEKLSVPDNDKTIDGLTGQVAGDSAKASVSNPEIQILYARNLDATLYELTNTRGGNIRNYAEFKRALEETGTVKLEQLDPMNHTRVSVVGQVLLTAMHLDVNFVDI